MNELDYDVAILGSGISGSILSLILRHTYGLKTLVIEKGSHPRFALGESSTYITSEMLRHLAGKYDLPELAQLAYYDDLKVHLPAMACGPKNYFYFLWHKLDVPQDDWASLHETVSELPRAVCQYYRQDLDSYLIDLAVARGVGHYDQSDLRSLHIGEDQVELSFERQNQTYQARARFIVDATGANSALANHLQLRIPPARMDNPLRSRSIFTHFKDIKPLAPILKDNVNYGRNWEINHWHATQHHCFPGGWFWIIPFDNGITSVGVNLDLDEFPENDKGGRQEFYEIVDRLPVVKELLGGATATMPFIKTARLQFASEAVAGKRWALLSSAAYGVDAWQSSGLAMTLMSIDRLVEVLVPALKHGTLSDSTFTLYQDKMRREFQTLSAMVAAIYKSFRHPEIFQLYCLVPFIGTLNFIKNMEYTETGNQDALLMHFGDAGFNGHLQAIIAKVYEFYGRDRIDGADVEQFRAMLTEDLRPYNLRNYGNPELNNAYFASKAELAMVQ